MKRSTLGIDTIRIFGLRKEISRRKLKIVFNESTDDFGPVPDEPNLEVRCIVLPHPNHSGGTCGKP